MHDSLGFDAEGGTPQEQVEKYLFLSPVGTVHHSLGFGAEGGTPQEQVETNLLRPVGAVLQDLSQKIIWYPSLYGWHWPFDPAFANPTAALPHL